MMEESEIHKSMKDQDVVDVNCMTKKDGNVQTKTFALHNIPEYVNIRYKCVQLWPYI